MTFSPIGATTPRFVGIDIGGTKVRAIVADAECRRLADATEPTSQDVLAQVRRLVVELGEGAAAAVGIGVPGTVDPLSGIVSKVPNVAALDGLPLARQLALEFGIPVAVENDLIAAALAELQVGGHGDSMVAVIAAGTGIGLGLVYRGELVRGARGAAGEIADIPLDGGGVLEDRLSIRGLIAGYRRAGGPVDHGVPEILARAERHDAAAFAAVDEYARMLAFAVRTVVAVVDPARVVLTGGLGSSDLVVGRLRLHLDESMSRRVTASELGADSPAHGAMLLALNAVSSPVPVATSSTIT